MKKLFLVAVAVALCCLCFTACNKPMEGFLSLRFDMEFDGTALSYGERVYEIASGEKINVGSIQFFVSDVYLVRKDGTREAFETYERNVHYVDSDLPETRLWKSEKKVPTGVYDYVEFVYGLDSSRNKSFAFVNPPESEMFWPEAMGGGYHYLKLNGHWGAASDTVLTNAFGFHAGALNGVSYSARLCDTLRIFLTEGQQKQLTLTMNVAEWFRNPEVWRFSEYGGSVMQNASAQRAIRRNAETVFTVSQ